MEVRTEPVDPKKLSERLTQFQEAWRRIGLEEKAAGHKRQYYEARGAYIALRQVRRFVLEDETAK